MKTQRKTFRLSLCLGLFICRGGNLLLPVILRSKCDEGSQLQGQRKCFRRTSFLGLRFFGYRLRMTCIGKQISAIEISKAPTKQKDRCFRYSFAPIQVQVPRSMKKAPFKAQRSGFEWERRNIGMDELSSRLTEANDMEIVSTPRPALKTCHRHVFLTLQGFEHTDCCADGLFNHPLPPSKKTDAFATVLPLSKCWFLGA